MDVLKTICENRWHGDIDVKKFEECPLCHSTAYHLSWVIGTVPEEPKEIMI